MEDTLGSLCAGFRVAEGCWVGIPCENHTPCCQCHGGEVPSCCGPCCVRGGIPTLHPSRPSLSSHRFKHSPLRAHLRVVSLGRELGSSQIDLENIFETYCSGHVTRPARIIEATYSISVTTQGSNLA